MEDPRQNQLQNSQHACGQMHLRFVCAVRPLCLVSNEPAASTFDPSTLRHLLVQGNVAIFKKGAPRWPIIFRVFSSHHSLDVSVHAPCRGFGPRAEQWHGHSRPLSKTLHGLRHSSC